MKRTIFIILMTFFIGRAVGFCLEEQQITGFSQSRVNYDTHFMTYDVLYVDIPDLSSVYIEGAESSSSLMEEDTEKHNMAYKYRMIFGKTLEKVLPVVYRERDKKNKREMILRIKLEGDMKETGLVENFMPGTAQRQAKVAIEGQLIDMSTREEIAYFYDEYQEHKKEDDISIFNQDDEEQWDQAVNLWSKYLADFLAKKRGAGYVFSKGG